MNRKQALLTDLGNVVLTFWERIDVVRAIIGAYGGNQIAVSKLFPQGTGEDLYDAMDSGQLDFRSFYEKFCHLSEISLPFEIFSKLWCHHLQVIEPVAEYFRILKVPIIAISNADSRFPAHLVQVYGGVNFLEVFISAEQQLKKPLLFERVKSFLLERGFDPEECPYVDDLPKYVLGAQEYGMPGILFDGSTQSVEILKTELAKYGIE